MRRLRDHGFSVMTTLLVVVVIAVAGVVGALIISRHTSSTSAVGSGGPASTGGATSSPGSTAGAGTALTGQPRVPTSGAYLGGWINPAKTPGNAGIGNNELAQVATFNSAIGKSVAIIHVYSGFQGPVPTATLNGIAANGSIPLINWGCTDVSSISSGAQDASINAFANGLKAYGKPVFLRWYWEFNEMSPNGNTPAGKGCNGYNNGPGFIPAWQHIYQLFKSDGALNVSFVWCPGYRGGNFNLYYPGDNYVDWIAVDRYQRTNNGNPLLSFKDMFSAYYDEWVGHGKPMMIAESAAMGGAQQSQYLASVSSEMPQFPQIKAFVYFDSRGPAGDWQLVDQGVAAFQALARSTYFITSTR